VNFALLCPNQSVSLRAETFSRENVMSFVSLPQACRFSFCWVVLLILLIAGSATLRAEDSKSKSQKAPSAEPSPSATDTTLTEAEKAAILTQEQTMAAIANKLVEEIQTQEQDLVERLSYFEKPTRLDPTSYASPAEITQWRDLLKELKTAGDSVASLYRNLGKTLDTELKNANVNEKYALQFRDQIIEGFPWDTIKKKDVLFAEFCEENSKLLDLYEKYWGAWKPAVNNDQPKSDNATANAAYRKLKDQILTTAKELGTQYAALTK
jgi:hypothetical protein